MRHKEKNTVYVWQAEEKGKLRDLPGILHWSTMYFAYYVNPVILVYKVWFLSIIYLTLHKQPGFFLETISKRPYLRGGEKQGEVQIIGLHDQMEIWNNIFQISKFGKYLLVLILFTFKKLNKII